MSSTVGRRGRSEPRIHAVIAARGLCPGDETVSCGASFAYRHIMDG